MTDWFLDPVMSPFLFAAAVLFGLVMVEIVGMLLGKSVGMLVDGLIGSDLAHGVSGLEWLNVGRVPLLILLMLWLAGFSVLGVGCVALLRSIGFEPSAWLTGPVAALLAVPPVRVMSGWVGRFIGRNQTTASDLADFVGRVGEVTLGPVRRGMMAKARFQGRHGDRHFQPVEPFHEAEEFTVGTAVLAVEVRARRLAVVKAEWPLRPGM